MMRKEQLAWQEQQWCVFKLMIFINWGNIKLLQQSRRVKRSYLILHSDSPVESFNLLLRGKVRTLRNRRREWKKPNINYEYPFLVFFQSHCAGDGKRLLGKARGFFKHFKLFTIKKILIHSSPKLWTIFYSALLPSPWFYFVIWCLCVYCECLWVWEKERDWLLCLLSLEMWRCIINGEGGHLRSNYCYYPLQSNVHAQ